MTEARPAPSAGIPLKTGKICGSVFAIAALAIVIVGSVFTSVSAIDAMQVGLAAMGVFFVIGFLLGRLGHSLVLEAAPQPQPAAVAAEAPQGPPDTEPAPEGDPASEPDTPAADEGADDAEVRTS